MDIRQQATMLAAEADQLLASNADDATMHQLAQAEALKISAFLQANGEALDAIDPSYVNELGARFDRLAGAASGTLSASLGSPVGTFFSDLPKQIEKQAEKLGDSVGFGLGKGVMIAVAVLAVVYLLPYVLPRPK
jgi:hypothetical protein